MAATHQLSSRILDVQTEWALAVALQTMSVSALDGLSTRRTQTVVEHLRAASNSEAISAELRAACGKLSDLWQTIDLQ